MGEPVVSVEGLSVQYNGKESTTYAVEDASLRLERGKVLALVGESGSGKSTVGHSILRLLPMQAEITAGRIAFDGHDLTTVDDETLRSIRGRRIAMIFQDPISGLNPVISIGDQVGEILESHMGVKRKEAKVRAIGILESVGLP
ncbi:MAG TPA: ATP-binding cassette domain-containing protein, partial [Tepidiformaceae bacterium]|nr:ATP-binding cassette domain-containing protein [Tepidiformaceae bacterium]